MDSLNKTAKKILIAEDEEDHARILSALFKHAGFHVDRAKDGLDAYAIVISENRPDLLITDVRMPGLTGFELLDKLKKENRMLPTTVVTAKQSEEDILRGLNYGALDYIMKPFSPSVVLAKVKAVLHRK